MMNSFFDKMGEKLMPFASKVSANRYLNAIKEGFFGVMPVIIVGSLFLLFTSIPINGYSELMTGLLGENWSQIFMVPYRMSYGIMSIYVVVGIARSLAHFYKVDTRESIVVSFIAIFMLTPVLVTEDGLKGLPLDNFSASGLFLAIITTCLAVEIFRFVVQKGWTIKLPDAVPQNVAKPFEALIPVAIIFIIFNFVRIGFEMTSFKSAQNFIFTMLQQPLQSIGSTLPATILVLLIESILWIFGLLRNIRTMLNFTIRDEKKQLYSKKSYYQEIDVFDTYEFGRVLVLDGFIMLTEKDEFIYHGNGNCSSYGGQS